MNSTKNLFQWLCAVLLVFGLYTLNAQTYFNTFDRAQPLGTGIVEVNGNFAHQSFSYDGESEGMFNTFGIRAGYGIGEVFDIKISYTFRDWDDEFFSDDKVNFFVFKPKYSFLEGQLAFALPIGIMTYKVGDDTESDQYISPEVMFNYRISDFIEAGINGRYIIPFEEDVDNLLAFNAAVGLSPNLDVWVIRPEVGLLFNPGEDGHYFILGAAFSYFIGGGY